MPGRVLVVFVISACAAVEAGLIVAGEPEPLLRGTGPLLLVSVGIWATFWLPRIRVGPADVVIVNPLRSIRVSWPAITDVRTRWGLELQTTKGRYPVWAAPRSGAIGAGRSARLAARRVETGAAAPREDAVRDAASAASVVVASRWTAYREAGLLGQVEGEGIEVHPHVVLIASLACLGVVSLLAALLP